MNQKVRTRAALLRAAGELVKEGRAPSMQEAAERALMSVATAYRYFSSADDLWWEATADTLFGPVLDDVAVAIERAGQDPAARLAAAVERTGAAMFHDQAVFRRMAKRALEEWFRQQELTPAEQGPVREGRRREQIELVLAPLREQLPKRVVDRLARALGVVLGTDPMLALVDGMGLEPAAAKRAWLDAARWLLAGALAELDSVEG